MTSTRATARTSRTRKVNKMGKYKIEWTAETWYGVIIEADTQEQAMEMWENNQYGVPEMDGQYLQDSVEITEVEE